MDEGKGYTLEMEQRKGYLYAVAGGEKLTAQISAAYWNEIAGRCFESECDKILIEKAFVQPVGPGDMLLMADHLGKLLPGRHIAFAPGTEERGGRVARQPERASAEECLALEGDRLPPG